jgi:hypothetical protein
MYEYSSFEEYFYEIKKIWQKLNHKNYIIPFCTPMKLNPKFLVIGMNHSKFSNVDSQNENISKTFSLEIPKINTFIEHNHTFADGLKKTINNLNIKLNNFDREINDDWIGTNRCAIQTDSSGLDSLKAHPMFHKCQNEMDKVLKSLIRYMKPKNIILAGNYASNLYYASDLKMKNLISKKIIINKISKETTNLIPIWHFSYYNMFKKEIVSRFEDSINKNLCEY